MPRPLHAPLATPPTTNFPTGAGLLRTDSHARRRAGWTLAAVLGVLGLVAALAGGLLLLTQASDEGTPLAAEIASPEGQRGLAGDPRSAHSTGDTRATAAGSNASPDASPLHVTDAQDDDDFYDDDAGRAGTGAPSGSLSVSAASGDGRDAAPLAPTGIAPTARPFSSSLTDRPRDRQEPRSGEASSERPRGAPPLQYQAAVERVQAERAAAEGITPEELVAPLENRGPRTLTKKELAERSKTLLEMRREGLRITGQLPANEDGDS